MTAVELTADQAWAVWFLVIVISAGGMLLGLRVGCRWRWETTLPRKDNTSERAYHRYLIPVLLGVFLVLPCIAVAAAIMMTLGPTLPVCRPGYKPPCVGHIVERARFTDVKGSLLVTVPFVLALGAGAATTAFLDDFKSSYRYEGAGSRRTELARFRWSGAWSTRAWTYAEFVGDKQEPRYLSRRGVVCGAFHELTDVDRPTREGLLNPDSRRSRRSALEQMRKAIAAGRSVALSLESGRYAVALTPRLISVDLSHIRTELGWLIPLLEHAPTEALVTTEHKCVALASWAPVAPEGAQLIDVSAARRPRVRMVTLAALRRVVRPKVRHYRDGLLDGQTYAFTLRGAQGKGVFVVKRVPSRVGELPEWMVEETSGPAQSPRYDAERVLPRTKARTAQLA